MTLLLPLLLATGPDPLPLAVKLPPSVTARPGRIVRIAAETASKSVRWVLASADADLVPLGADGKTALFCSPTPGRYVVFAWTAAGDEPSEAARCEVVVEEPAPPPPPPDSLAEEFRKLAAADAGLDKAAHLAQLAAIYREAVRYADNTDVKTAGELASRIRAAASSLLPGEALVGVRKRIAEEIARQLPIDGDQPLDAASRRTAAILFQRIATSLEAVK